MAARGVLVAENKCEPDHNGIENMNAEFIHMKLSQGDRLKRLNAIAIRQMQVFTAAPAIRQLKG